MAQLYTNAIITPSVCAFHDIESVTSLERWVDSYTYNYTTIPTVSAPFYLNRPLQTFFEMQYGFAPYTRAYFFAYGTEFFDTTACYHIYDPHKKNTPTKICRFIPSPESLTPPPSSQVLARIPGDYSAGSWYITIARHPTQLSDQKTVNITINAININGDINLDIESIDLEQEIPEIELSVLYNETLNELQVISQVNTFLQQQNATYNIVANGHEIPNLTYLDPSYVYEAEITSSDSVYTIPDVIKSSGKLFTFIHNSQKGELLETTYVSGSDTSLIQSNRILSTTPGLTGVSLTITENGALSAILPITPVETWFISGFAIDTKDITTSTPKKLLSYDSVSTGYTLIDSVTTYNASILTPHDETAIPNAGAISVKYDLCINSGSEGQYRESTVNVFNIVNDTPQVHEEVLANNLTNIDTVQLSAKQINDNVIDIYAKVDSGTWNVSGYKTEIYYNSLFSTNTIDSIANILSSSWANNLTYNTFTTGRLNVLPIDTVYYNNDGNFTYGARWDVTLATLGGEVIVSKTVYSIWSPPALGKLYQTEEVNTVFNETFYSENSASFNLFTYYQYTNPIGPVILGLITDLPLEIYATRTTFSGIDSHPLENAFALPFSIDLDSTGVITSKTASINQFNKYGSSFELLAINKNNPEDITILTHNQLVSKNNAGYNTNSKITSNSIATVTLTSIFTPIGSTDYTVHFGLSSNTDASDFYVAGYEIPNVTAYTPQLTAFNSTQKNIFPGITSTQIDTIPTTFGYDGEWFLTVEDLSRNSNIQYKLSILFNNLEASFPLTTVQVISSENTNSAYLSGITPYITKANETIYLNVSTTEQEIEALSGAFISSYIKGASNNQIFYPLDPIYPSAPYAIIDHVFTYPGTYTVEVSAVTGSITSPDLVDKFIFPDYFKILDIPPVPRFDITNHVPSLADYDAVRASSECLCPSYYNKKSTATSTLTSSKIYLNTWTTAPGSYPIEELWIDFGDNTGVQKISRLRDSFLQEASGFAFYTIKQDPRNAILSHTYELSSNEPQSFTITVSAFSMNSRAMEISQRIISDLPPLAPAKKYILNNSILDSGEVLLTFQTSEVTTNLSEPCEVSELIYNNPKLQGVLLK